MIVAIASRSRAAFTSVVCSRTSAPHAATTRSKASFVASGSIMSTTWPLGAGKRTRVSIPPSLLSWSNTAASQLKQARAAFDLFCAELPRALPPAAQIELIEERQEIRERFRQRRESLATLAQGEAEENLRGRLENFAEDEAIVRLEAMKDEDHQLADEINETYARSKELTARLETATGGTGAELAAQQAKNAEAEMLANAREWAVYRFGQILLSRAIEEHRTQNQNPLLRQAGELFQRLTGGSFIGVEEEFDSRDNPRLVGRRESAGTVPIERMSQGTR